MTDYGSFSDAYENAVLDHVLQGGASPLTPPSNIYVGLSTADPLDDGSGLAEPAGGGYARVLWNNWNTAANRGASNNGSIVFPKATAGWGTISHYFLVDADAGGNIIAQGPLAAAKTVNTDNVFSLASAEAEIHFRRWKLFFEDGGTYEIQPAILSRAAGPGRRPKFWISNCSVVPGPAGTPRGSCGSG